MCLHSGNEQRAAEEVIEENGKARRTDEKGKGKRSKKGEERVRAENR